MSRVPPENDVVRIRNRCAERIPNHSQDQGRIEFDDALFLRFTRAACR
jgi:hypothetical protein